VEVDLEGNVIPSALFHASSAITAHTSPVVSVDLAWPLTSSTHIYTMDALVAKLQPQSFRREEEEEDSTGYGNLDSRGFVTGMALPRVADVSVCT